MKLDDQAYLDLLADLQGRGYGGALAELREQLGRQAFCTQLHLLERQVERHYGARHQAAKQFFRQALALAAKRCSHLRGDGPVLGEPRLLFTRTLSPAQEAGTALRVTWFDVRVDEDGAGLTVCIAFYGKRGLLRERRLQFPAD
jgi:hypothetical protein